MSKTVTLPLWLLVLLALLALVGALERLLIPSARWLIRRRVNRMLEEINTRLKISIPSFKLTRREVLIDRLLYDPQVQEAAAQHSRDSSEPIEVVMGTVRRYAREIVPAFNAYAYFRIGYGLARNLARSLYRVRLGHSDEEGLSRIGPKSTVVFLMNHRSNMDYILVGYLAAEKAALSYAVGEWARIWPLQTLVRSMGAYFVRRNSRDGKLRPPKLGILDYMVRGFDPAGERDIAFIPVGINYDRTLEDRTLLSEQAPDFEKPGAATALGRSFKFFGRNLRLLAANQWHRFGYACVNFGTPISLKSWAAEHAVNFGKASKEERFALVEKLAQELLSAVARVIPVVPVSLVATAFVREPGRSWSELELKAEALRLSSLLDAKGAHIYVPRGDQDYAIDVGLRMLTLRHLVDEREGLFTPRREELPILAYYANSIAHLFSDPSPEGRGRRIRLSRDPARGSRARSSRS